MTQTIEQLTARLRELEEENARLIREVVNRNQRALDGDKAVKAADALYEQLAAEQLNNKLLRDWISKKSTHSYSCDCLWLDDDGKRMACSCGLTAAIAIPRDTSALDAYVAEKAEEAYLNAQRAHAQFEAGLTRQRDLAVEALKSCGVNDGLNGPTQYFDEDLVERAIKESE